MKHLLKFVFRPWTIVIISHVCWWFVCRMGTASNNLFRPIIMSLNFPYITIYNKTRVRQNANTCSPLPCAWFYMAQSIALYEMGQSYGDLLSHLCTLARCLQFSLSLLDFNVDPHLTLCPESLVSNTTFLKSFISCILKKYFFFGRTFAHSLIQSAHKNAICIPMTSFACETICNADDRLEKHKDATCFDWCIWFKS